MALQSGVLGGRDLSPPGIPLYEDRCLCLSAKKKI